MRKKRHRTFGPVAWLLSAASSSPRGSRHLRRETTVSASLQDTFAFFADASNLEQLTPPWLNFAIRTPIPIALRAGVEIDYRISLYGFPVPWRSRIDVWEPGVRFVDRQIIGPYRWWRHEHWFEAVHQGTRVIDDVEYVPRVAWLTNTIVRRQLEEIFTYRQKALHGIFGMPPRSVALGTTAETTQPAGWESADANRRERRDGRRHRKPHR